MLLDVQVQIAARRRGYDAAAHDRLFELFGPVADWGTTLRTLLWTRTTLVVPAFEGSTVVDLDVPCCYDLEVAASRYLDALSDGDGAARVPVQRQRLLHRTATALQTTRLSWESEAEYRLPVRVWKETMERYFRGTAWVRLTQGELRPAVGLQVAQRARDLGRRAGGARAYERPAHARRRGHVRGLHALAVPRRRALKNQRRWTFGCVFPPAWTALHPDDADLMRTQVLLESDPHDVEVTVRFLQEGVERSVGPWAVRVRGARRRRRRRGRRAAADGDDPQHDAVGAARNREEALRHALCSTHTLLVGGRFVSATEADGCENVGTWPVLVGDDSMLSSPIILEDHPRIAPESPGDLFDGGEIDGLLALNIMALTD